MPRRFDGCKDFGEQVVRRNGLLTLHITKEVEIWNIR